MRRTPLLLTLLALIGLPLLTVALPAQAAPTAKLWDPVRASGWELTVRSIERITISPSEGETETIALLTVDLTNRSARTRTPKLADFALSSADRARYVNLSTSATAQMIAQERATASFTASLASGETVTTQLLFAVPRESGRFTLWFRPAGTAIQIDECHCNLPSPVRTVG